RALQAALPFFTHAILLDRAFAHCPRFPTAAPRGSPGRVSVPVWLIVRKDQLSIIGLVSLYLTNYLILRRLIKQRFIALFRIWPELFGRFPRVTHPFATLFSTLLTSWARQL
ncbi:ATP synthase subunit alpha, partial [Dorcoceras hygrometricum]